MNYTKNTELHQSQHLKNLTSIKLYILLLLLLL